MSNNNQVVVEIEPKQVVRFNTNAGTKNGKNWSISTQPVYIFFPGDKYPMEVELVIRSMPPKPFPAGVYSLSSTELFSCFYIGDYRRLSFNLSVAMNNKQPDDRSDSKKHLDAAKMS